MGKTWTIRGLAGTLILLCAARGALGQKTDKNQNQAAAIVNGEVIGMAELEAAVKQNGQTAAPQPEAVRKQQRQIILGGLIDATLMRQFLKQNAPQIDPKEINGKMSELAAGLQKQGQSLGEFCRDLNQTPEQLREKIAAIFQWNVYARQHVSDQQIEQYYRENKDLFDQVRVRLSEIMLRVPAQATEGERTLARDQLTALRAKLAANQIDFAEAAKKHSQGPTKDQGGDLEWWPHIKHMELLPDNLLETAFSMQPGQISEVIQTEFGYHLIKVTDRKVGKQSQFDQVKEDARQLCMEEMQRLLLNQLRQKAEIKILLP